MEEYMSMAQRFGLSNRQLLLSIALVNRVTQRKNNTVLEAPFGTGKTQIMLMTALALIQCEGAAHVVLCLWKDCSFYKHDSEYIHMVKTVLGPTLTVVTSNELPL